MFRWAFSNGRCRLLAGNGRLCCAAKNDKAQTRGADGLRIACALFGWVHKPTQEQEGAGAGVADEKYERVVGAEDRRRWFRLSEAPGKHCGDRRSGSFSALFVDLSPCFVEHA